MHGICGSDQRVRPQRRTRARRGHPERAHEGYVLRDLWEDMYAMREVMQCNAAKICMQWQTI